MAQPTSGNNVRFAAESLYQNAPYVQQQHQQRILYGAMYRRNDYVAGYRHNGRMSASRRLFSLFVTFDLVFVGLLWLICILIDGTDIYEALRKQILEYDRHNSLFDIVVLATWRFVLLIFFYAILSFDHWFTSALSTSSSCILLIYKVFVYNWADKDDHVLHVLVILISFILAWCETLLLDCQVIPNERLANRFVEDARLVHESQQQRDAPALASAASAAPFLHESLDNGPSTYYSLADTQRNSDDEPEDEQDLEWQSMGDECVLRAARLLESDEWTVDRVTDAGDTIRFIQQPMGKVWRITARVEFPPRELLEHLFCRIQDMSAWNTTILEAKILRTINANTDIAYQISAPYGMIGSRVFLNLRCWHLVRNGRIVDEDDDAPNVHPISSSAIGTSLHRNKPKKRMTKSVSVAKPPPSPTGFDGRPNALPATAPASLQRVEAMVARSGLARSSGATGFFDDNDDEPLLGSGSDSTSQTLASRSVSLRSVTEADAMYISSAISINYDRFQPKKNCTLAENKLSCWAMREVHGNPNVCVFEWLMCIDLKMYLPTSIVNKTYPKVMADFMVMLRKYCEDEQNRR